MKTRLLSVMLCIFTGLAGSFVHAAEEGKPVAAPPPPSLTFAFELRAKVADAVVIGQVPHGTRRFVPMLSGTLIGPMINASVVPGSGGDWLLVQPDGFTELDARYTVRTSSGELVYVQNSGMRHAPPDVMQKLNAGQAVDPKLVYFRSVPKFETSAPGLQWITRSIFVGVGERTPNEVIIRFYRVE
ncbi:MAG: DUF3237 domain-containing protein [Pseudomonadota bacterium]